MQAISRSSEYAIRAMTYLAQKHGQGFQLSRDIAETLGIPGPFLGKILQPLVLRGLLHSQRGRSGGFHMIHRPTEVTLFQIVDAQEHLSATRKCLLGQAECSDERACPMHEYWDNCSESFLALLAQTTLQNVVDFCSEKPASGYPGPTPDAPLFP
ncbi:MAG: Rrf2 family transcriptional regulator [Planctomycetes bacterium]|jgi:Rrf2 family protein|nr:Rrf2 family transcriptional regulator [Planctomycetota bacterium]